MEGRKEAFRMYLEETGLTTAMTKCIVKLYELKDERPDTPEAVLEFMKTNLSDDFPTQDEFDKLEAEVKRSRAQVAAIKKKWEDERKQAEDEKQKKVEAKRKAKEAALAQKNAAQQALQTPTAMTVEEAKAKRKKLKEDGCKSLLVEKLTDDILDELWAKKTAKNMTLLDCIKAGLEKSELPVGIYAADSEAYVTFQKIFAPIIAELHNFAETESDCSPTDMNDASASATLDEIDNSTLPGITNVKISCARSAKDFPLHPTMTKDDYDKLLKKFEDDVISTFTGNNVGKLYKIDGISATDKAELETKKQLFDLDNEILEAAGARNFWPHGRAVFATTDGSVVVWINDEEHLTFIASSDTKILEPYDRLRSFVNEWRSKLDFEKHQRYGWITFCPTNLGSTIRASVMVELPKLVKEGKSLGDLETMLVAQPSLNIIGDPSKSKLFEVSNKPRLNKSEVDTLTELIEGVKSLLNAEKAAPP